jgi:hypothetical protein
VKPKLVAALRSVHDAEAALADAHRKIGERHAAEHDVFHICHTLALQSEAHAGHIREAVRRTGTDLPEDGQESPLHGLVASLRRATSEVVGRSDKTGALLLRDLRNLHSLACDCEIAWTIAGQGAKAAREQEVIEMYAQCCEEIVGQLRWIKTKVKLAAPQVVAVG